MHANGLATRNAENEADVAENVKTNPGLRSVS